MDYKDIKKLIDDMGNSNLDSLEIEFPEGIKISMTKNTKKEVINVIEGSAPMTVPAIREEKGKSLVNVENQTKADNYKIVKKKIHNKNITYKLFSPQVIYLGGVMDLFS